MVCPTGIDIRNGLQIDCIGCARCIDACDEVMLRLGRARGLVRYDSQHGFAGEKKRLLRPRLYLYGALGLVGAIATSIALASSRPYEADLLRLQGAPPFGHAPLAYTIAIPELELASLASPPLLAPGPARDASQPVRRTRSALHRMACDALS